MVSIFVLWILSFVYNLVLVWLYFCMVTMEWLRWICLFLIIWIILCYVLGSGVWWLIWIDYLCSMVVGLGLWMIIVVWLKVLISCVCSNCVLSALINICALMLVRKIMILRLLVNSCLVNSNVVVLLDSVIFCIDGAIVVIVLVCLIRDWIFWVWWFLKLYRCGCFFKLYFEMVVVMVRCVMFCLCDGVGNGNSW